jgi:hypothetical protein
MLVRGVVTCGVNLALLASCRLTLGAQAPVAPTAYTVTVVNSLFGPGEWMKTSRLGSKVLVDQIAVDKMADPKAPRVHTLYDLEKHRNISWYSPDSSAGCSIGTFSGDWGDPFGGIDDLFGQATKQVGTETILGFAARIVEASAQGNTLRAWVDSKTGLVLKAQLSQAGAAPKTIIEVKAVSLTPPPASIFAVPENCAAEAAAPPPPTEEEKIAALTGGNAQDFVKAIYGPGSKDSCSVLFRVVKAGSMEPILSGFQVALDLNRAHEGSPSYTIGLSNEGHATFSGGGLHEVTSQIRNGVLRIDNPPDHFDLETAFGNGGSGSALIYKQCFAPQTVLLYVITNPDKLSDGAEFLWVKSGKYATVTH